MKIDRRNMLRGAGSAALAASLTQLFQMHRGRAQAAGPTPKVVFFYTPCGLQVDLWHPTETGASFNLKQLSAPLEPHKQECIFMDGVAMYPLSDHQGGSQQMLVGDEKDVMTMDLKLGEQLKNASPFGYVNIGIQSRISKGGTATVPHPHFSRVSLAQEVFPEENPLVAFERLFSGADTGMDAAAAAARLKQEKSVLDAANADLVSLSSSLPTSEKLKVERYTESLRALERRLTDAGGPLACDLKGFNPTGFTVPQANDPNQAAYNKAENRQVVGDLQMEIARLALACGRTRVVTLIWEHTNAHHPITGIDKFGVHDASHYTAPPGQLTGDATPEQVDAKLTAWNAYRVWYAERLAQFIQMLKDTPDTDGSSLLDNTILFHCSELGLGHRTQRVPFMFIGGKNLGFKVGQAINFTGSVPAYGQDPHKDLKQLAHSSLLTLIANKMGLPLDGTRHGFSGPQALDPMSLGIV
jgi:hypothetical protein